VSTRKLSPTDQLLASADTALRTLFAKPHATRPMPLGVSEQVSLQVNTDAACQAIPPTPSLTDPERRHAAGLMRVNHVGEICAQALYSAQALTAKTDTQRAMLEHAAREETDHLAWTATRLAQLGSRPSRLNPLWYAGAFGLGLIAGQLGDRVSLGFVVETEAQVEAHLASHLVDDLGGLPANDLASRAIAAQMQRDEAEHGLAAQQAGAAQMPAVVKVAMGVAAKVMTTTAYRI
jgi:3-demethoxyubiquinol 3-hydroxylase